MVQEGAAVENARVIAIEVDAPVLTFVIFSFHVEVRMVEVEIAWSRAQH